MKIGKRGVYLLWVSFDLENGPFWPSGPLGSIGKVFTDIQVKFLQKLGRNFGSPKNTWTIAQENRQKWGIYLIRDSFDFENWPFYP